MACPYNDRRTLIFRRAKRGISLGMYETYDGRMNSETREGEKNNRRLTTIAVQSRPEINQGTHETGAQNRPWKNRKHCHPERKEGRPCRPGCRGTACRTLFILVARPNQAGTASRTPITGREWRRHCFLCRRPRGGWVLHRHTAFDSFAARRIHRRQCMRHPRLMTTRTSC
jgi:hypothetical protein